MDNNLNQALIKGTKDIFRDMLGMELKASEPLEKCIKDTYSDVCVIITFVGDINGAFILNISKKLSRLITTRMLGVDVDEHSNDLKDAIGEMLNMITGSLKKHYNAEGDPFKISIPTTIVGDRFEAHIKTRASEKVSYVEFYYLDHMFSIELYLKI